MAGSTSKTFTVVPAMGEPVDIQAASAVEDAGNVVKFLDENDSIVAAFRGYNSFYIKA